jgi:hypothetical protein
VFCKSFFVLVITNFFSSASAKSEHS